MWIGVRIGLSTIMDGTRVGIWATILITGLMTVITNQSLHPFPMADVLDQTEKAVGLSPVSSYTTAWIGLKTYYP